MKGAITATHILLPGFLGLIIGGAILGNTAAWISGLVLLILDIIVGIALQYFYERSVKSVNNYNRETFEAIQALKNYFENDGWDDLTFEEKRKRMAASSPRDKELQNELKRAIEQRSEEIMGESIQDTDNESIYDRLHSMLYNLLNSGGKQEIKSMDDEAAQLLVDFCGQMPYAPSGAMLTRMDLVSTVDVGELEAIVYSFEFQPYSVGQIAFVFLVEIDVEQFRFFTVETTFSTPESGPCFMLCEYNEGKHLNYGFVEWLFVPERIAEIICGMDKND